MIDDVSRQWSPRWDRQAPFVETWCATLNHVNSGAGFWIRYAIVVPGDAPARGEVWFASFTPGSESASAAVGCRFGADDIEADRELGFVRIGPCLIEPDGMTGMLAVDGTPVTWELEYKPVTEPLRYMPEYSPGRYGFAVPYPFMLIGGRIQVRDHQFALNGDPGQQSHSWGENPPSEWMWFHCSAFIREGGDPIPAYVTGLSLRRLLIAGIPRPAVSFGHLVWNQTHIPIRPEHAWRDRTSTEWAWGGASAGERMDVRLKIPWSDMVVAEHSGPSGLIVRVHHTDLATCSLRMVQAGRAPTLFTAAGLAHAEIVSTRPDPRVQRFLRVV
jgi:hypothetical protein